MDLSPEQAKTLITHISNIDSTISEFWELYNDALGKLDTQMELNGETYKNIELIASKIQVIENHTKTQTDYHQKELIFLEQLVTNTKKDQNQQKETKDIIKSSFASLNLNIKALRNSLDSDREESGLLRDDSNTQLTKVLNKLGYKIEQLMEQNSNIKPINIKKDDSESGSLLGGLLTAGLGIAGISFIWGLIKDNPAVQQFLDSVGNFWNEYVQPKIEWVWDKMVAGLGDLWGRAWDYLKEHPALIAALAAVGGLGLVISPLIGGIVALTAATAGLLVWFEKFKSDLKIFEEKNLETWNKPVEIEQKMIDNIKSQNLPPELAAKKMEQARLFKEYETTLTVEMDLREQKEKLTGWEMPWDDTEERVNSSLEHWEKRRQIIFEKQKKLEEEIKNFEKENLKMDNIKKENSPISVPSGIQENTSSSPITKLQPINSTTSQSPITKQSPIAVYNDSAKDNTVMVDYLANIHKSLEDLNSRMDQNTEVNLQGHIANAQATINSVPPPPVINIPKPKLNPNTTRHLANVYTDPNYNLT